eukprot:evm.model.scf_303EXC.2 EVM.evm.TU.scf_303EXC.2   scf_303EXC:15520-25201(-)
MNQRLLFLCAAALLAATAHAARSLQQTAAADVRMLEDMDLGIASLINDGYKTNLKNFDACAKLCIDTRGCLSFTFHKQGSGSFEKGNCFLLDVIPIAKPSKTTDSGVVPPRVSEAEECKPEDNIFFLGENIFNGNLLRTPNGNECCLRCQENNDCVAYTWLGEGACILKSEISGKVKCEDCVSGIPGGEDNDSEVVVAADPQVPGGGNWEELLTGALNTPVKPAWDAIKDPIEAIKYGFRHLAYTVDQDGDGPITVALSSGETIAFDVVETADADMYHVFQVANGTDALFHIPPDSASFVGSYHYIHLVPDQGSGNARVNMGFKANIKPAKVAKASVFFFGEFLEVLIENLKLRFGDGDCLHDPTVRTPQGTCNNPYNPTWGAAFSRFGRLPENDPAFADRDSEPSGSDVSPRLISNEVSAGEAEGGEGGKGDRTISDALLYFGLFVFHDMFFNPGADLVEGPVPFFTMSQRRFYDPLPIEVPEEDDTFGAGDLNYSRGAWVRENNEDVSPRAYLNQVTSYLDLGPVYGGNDVRARALRSGEGGALKTDGAGFLPRNGLGPDGVGISLQNVPNAGSEFYVTGDARSGESVNLLAFHALWLKEHNLVAAELLEASEESLSDDELYEYAKEIVIAEYQSIVFQEFLPVILCPETLNADDWRYDRTLDASVDLFFATVSSRFLHSMYGSTLWKVATDSNFPPKDPTDEMPPRATFGQPAGDVLSPENFEEWLLGMFWHEAGAVDTVVPEDLRSFWATQDPVVLSGDLMAINIQQARDFGLPMYNDAREAFNLTRAETFSDITGGDTELADKLEKLYGKVDLVDPIIGGLAEKPSEDCRLVGDLFYENIKENFARIRDGDRLFYKGFTFTQMLVDIYPRLDSILRDEVQLHDIIVRNTGITSRMLGGATRESVFAVES